VFKVFRMALPQNRITVRYTRNLVERQTKGKIFDNAKVRAIIPGGNLYPGQELDATAWTALMEDPDGKPFHRPVVELIGPGLIEGRMESWRKSASFTAPSVVFPEVAIAHLGDKWTIIFRGDPLEGFVLPPIIERGSAEVDRLLLHLEDKGSLEPLVVDPNPTPLDTEPEWRTDYGAALKEIQESPWSHVLTRTRTNPERVELHFVGSDGLPLV
jgi:hypothetical protein